jgi:DNA-binding MarR family transcriptional regulator
MPTRTGRSHPLERAISSLARRGTLGRLHRALIDTAGVDIDRAAYLVLRRLHLGGPARIGDLATRFGVEPSTVSRHVRMLESRGLLVKLPDVDDRRAMQASVTPDGAALVAAVERERHALLDEALADWPEDDVARFVKLMERFTDDLTTVLDRWEERS